MVINMIISMHYVHSNIVFPTLSRSSTTRKSQQPVLEPTKTVAEALTVVLRMAVVLVEAVAMIQGMDRPPRPARVECLTLPCAH